MMFNVYPLPVHHLFQTVPLVSRFRWILAILIILLYSIHSISTSLSCRRSAGTAAFLRAICQGIRLSFSTGKRTGHRTQPRTLALSAPGKHCAQQPGKGQRKVKNRKIKQESHRISPSPAENVAAARFFTPRAFAALATRARKVHDTERLAKLWLTPHQKDLSGHAMARP